MNLRYGKDSRIILNPEYSNLEDIKELVRVFETAYYAIGTTWWTVNPANLYKHPECDLPCDPRGSMLMEAPASKFIKSAEDNLEHYGTHALKAFEAAYHGNIIIEENGWPTSISGWDNVNKLLTQRYL
jgi:hypothetical protein